MRKLIERKLIGSAPAPDPVAAALEALPPGVAEAWFDQPPVAAAVLVPLVARDEAMSVLLTRRTAHLRDHPGQVSFPGGRCEPGDAGAADTALREAREETGIGADLVAIAGFLQPLAIPTGFAVTPVVGFVAPDYSLDLDVFEVEDAFEVPLDFLLDERNLVPTRRKIRGIEERFCEYHYRNHRIWGATALMLKQLIDLIGQTSD